MTHLQLLGGLQLGLKDLSGSGATKLKDVSFDCARDTQWIVAVLRSLAGNHGNLQKISIYAAYILNGPDRADYYDDPANIRRAIGEADYQGWLELDSPTVGAAYNSLVAKMRQKSSDYRKEALSSPPTKEDKDIEITPYDYNARAEQDHCIAVMRQELRFFKRPFRNLQKLPSDSDVGLLRRAGQAG